RAPDSAAKERLISSVGDRDRRERCDRASEAELARAEGTAAHAIVEVDDAKSLTARDERYGEDAPELQRVDAVMNARELARRVDRDDGLACGEGSTSERLRERHLLAAEIRASQVSCGARGEAIVRGLEEEEAALDAGPEDERVDHAVQERAEAIALAQGV